MTSPSARFNYWASFAMWRTGGTARRPKIHEHLIPFPRQSNRNNRVCNCLSFAFAKWLVHHACKHTSDIGVNNSNINMFCECQHCTCRVFTNSRKRKQLFQICRYLRIVIAHHHLCGFMQVATASRISKALPNGEQVRKWSICAFARRRKGVNEQLKFRNNPINLGLLRHHFAHQHVPSIPCGAPWEISQLWQSPLQQWVNNDA